MARSLYREAWTSRIACSTASMPRRLRKISCCPANEASGRSSAGALNRTAKDASASSASRSTRPRCRPPGPARTAAPRPPAGSRCRRPTASGRRGCPACAAGRRCGRPGRCRRGSAGRQRQSRRSRRRRSPRHRRGSRSSPQRRVLAADDLQVAEPEVGEPPDVVGLDGARPSAGTLGAVSVSGASFLDGGRGGSAGPGSG